MNLREERELWSIFDAGLILKAIGSAFEVLAGIAVFVVPREFVVRIADLATAGELANDPNDFVASTLREAAHAFAVHSHYVLAAYLLIRGALKLGIVLLILLGVEAAYPVFIVVLGLFGTYEAYKAVLDTNIWLGIVCAFDTGLIFLTAYEYKRKNPYSSQV